MHRAFRATLAVIACLVASAPRSADAAGDPRPPLSDLVSFSNINEWVARVSLLFVRSVVDLTYKDITNDPYANRTMVTGIVIRPALTWDRGQQCRLLAEQLSLSCVTSNKQALNDRWCMVPMLGRCCRRHDDGLASRCWG